MITLAFLIALVGVAWWVLASPLRAALVPALVVAAPSTPSVVLAALGVALVAGAGWLVWRSLAESGWWLVIVARPALTGSGGGG